LVTQALARAVEFLWVADTSWLRIPIVLEEMEAF
jgi:hypothetical protein